jgi:NAD(P)-dependent dehydrogenase (short-subunit alcohol dehydrogenase family)
MARSLAANGAAVAVGSLSEPDNREAVAVLEAHGARTFSQHLDVTSRRSCEDFVGRVVDEFGRLDVMVCNAGVSRGETALETTEETWARTIGVDLTGVFNTAVAAARAMMKTAAGGSVVVTSSNASLVAFDGLAAYGAAKAGVNQLVRSLAVEWGAHNIRVNAVAPGWTDHRMEGNDHRADAAVAGAAVARTPLKRFGTADEIAAAVLFLASDAASFVTGAILPVDGGFVAG